MRAHKVDANQQEIVNALRQVGASVLNLSAVGEGCPDLLVGYGGVNYLIEVKNLAGRGKRMTLPEMDFADTWRGQTAIVINASEALEVLGWEL